MKGTKIMKIPKSSRESVATGTMTPPPPRMGPPVPVTTTTPVKARGPRQIGENVTFVARYPNAKTVQLAGDFNNWQPAKNPMTKESDGSWQVRIPLSKGIYRYRFVVDGQWQQDPGNDLTEPNPYGGLNSVLKVT
jgi:hypothetical protein